MEKILAETMEELEKWKKRFEISIIESCIEELTSKCRKKDLLNFYQAVKVLETFKDTISKIN